MIFSAAVQFIVDFCSLRMREGSQALSYCQETLSTSLSQRHFCLTLRPEALRKLLPYFSKCTPAPLGLAADRASPSGYGYGVSVPCWGIRGSCPGRVAVPLFPACPWPSGRWGWAGEQDLGRETNKEWRRWRGAWARHLGSLRPELGAETDAP